MKQVSISLNIKEILNGFIVSGNIGENGQHDEKYEATKAKAIEFAKAHCDSQIDQLSAKSTS